MPFTRLISYSAKAEKRYRDFIHLGVLIAYAIFFLILTAAYRDRGVIIFDSILLRAAFIVVLSAISALIFFRIYLRKYALTLQFLFSLNTFYILFLTYINGFPADYILELVMSLFISCLFIRKRWHLRIYMGLVVASFLLIQLFHAPFYVNLFLWNALIILTIAPGILLFFEKKILSEKKAAFKDNLFDIIFNQSNDLLILVDPLELTVVNCNNRALKQFGYKETDNILRLELSSLLKPKGYYTSWEMLLKANDEQVVETEIRNIAMGSDFWGRISCRELDVEAKKYLLINIVDITERVNKEILLEQNKEMLMKIINVLPHQIYLKDSRGRFILVNNSVLKAQNTTLPEIVGKTDRDMFSPEQAAKFEEIEQEIIRTGKIQEIPEEYNYDQEGNLVRILYTTKIPFFLPDRNETGILGVNIDITENKLAEKTIRENEAKYKMLLEQASDGIYLADEDGKIIDANSKACEMFGYTKEEFLSKNIKDLTDPEHSKATMAKVTDKARHNIMLERLFIKKDGSPFTVEISARLLDHGGHQAILRDITERKRIEEILRENERKFRALIENSSDMILILNERFRIKYISPSALKILGYTEQDVLNHFSLEFIHPEDKEILGNILTNIYRNPGINHLLNEIRVRNSSKEYRYVELVGVNLLEDNVIKGIIINFHDITERKNTEIALINTNFELDSFVYRASHDMKAPLRSIMGLINITKLEAIRQPNILEYLQMMENSVLKLDGFLKDLTNFVRDSRLEIVPEAINFEEVINESLNSLKFLENAHIIAIIKDLDVKLKFYSDVNRINTIINNLLSNSFKYHKNIENESYIRINIRIEADKAVLVIEDNGSGIDRKYLDKIFDMFYRASEKSYGSGLGLYIVKMAVTKLYGSIQVDSEPDKGTRFTVILPNLLNSK